jgi:uncharacterized membrane protein YoaK (UPF0700 family)
VRSLTFVLSIVAGSVDAIGFLGLNGLFTAHVTGNLVVLAAHAVAGTTASLALIISVPVFIVAIALTRLLAAGFERAHMAPLRIQLALHLLLLCAFLAVCLFEGATVNSDAPSMIVAGMLGVCAMAVQNALVRIALPGEPATAVLTSNITQFTLDLVELLIGRTADNTAHARARARRTWPSIAGFLVGCTLGAACEAAVGLKSLVVPTGLALIALLLSIVRSGTPTTIQSTEPPI